MSLWWAFLIVVYREIERQPGFSRAAFKAGRPATVHYVNSRRPHAPLPNQFVDTRVKRRNRRERHCIYIYIYNRDVRVPVVVGGGQVLIYQAVVYLRGESRAELVQRKWEERPGAKFAQIDKQMNIGTHPWRDTVDS